MRKKILHAATEMFLELGFKSVTMDDIASNIGISKKTIYTSFDTKSKLIEAVIDNLYEKIRSGIMDIKAAQKNPIEEILEIKALAMRNLKEEKTSPQYQLKKYYPRVYRKIHRKQFELVQRVMIENLERGITTGDYRPNLPISFISRIHFVGMLGIKDKELFPSEEYSNARLMDFFIEYHLRAITTLKGFQSFQELISKEDHANEN